MSIWAANRAFQLDVPNQTHKLTLLSLANFADDENEARPHVKTLAKMASVSARSAFRALAAPEAAGLISRTTGLRKSNSSYRLHVPNEVSRRAGQGEGRPKLLHETPSGSQGDTGDPTNLTPVSGFYKENPSHIEPPPPYPPRRRRR